MHVKMSSAKWQPFCLGLNVLILLVIKLGYHWISRSISSLLMPWLLMSPGHQQLWYWLCSISMYMSPTISEEELQPFIPSQYKKCRKCKHIFMFPRINEVSPVSGWVIKFDVLSQTLDIRGPCNPYKPVRWIPYVPPQNLKVTISLIKIE